MPTNKAYRTEGRMRWWLALTAAVLSGLLLAAGQAEKSSERILAGVRYLASDQLQGRGVGTPGLDRAADWVADQFRQAGLKPVMPDGSFFQPFQTAGPSRLGNPNRLALHGPDDKPGQLELNKDFIPVAFSKAGQFSGPLVFAGYGITAPEYHYDDYAGLDVKGKVVLVMRREPRQSGEADPHQPFLGSRDTRHAALMIKAANAARRGAAAILFVTDPHTLRSEPDRLMPFGYADGPSRGVVAVHITAAVANSILQSALGKDLAALEAEIDQDLKPRSQTLKGWSCSGHVTVARTPVPVKNVLARLPGTGPRAEQTIVIGAHYDHLGYGQRGSLSPKSHEVHNGADDNASGTVAMVELAHRLAGRPKPLGRSVLFIAFTAEERGLVGSRYYVGHPALPLKSAVAMINLDMVGRLRKDKLIVYGTGTAKQFGPLLEKLNQRHHFDLRKIATGYGPSDQISFYQRKIPVLHFFTDLHRDYHRPSDDWQKISIEGMERVVGLVEEVVVELAESEKRPEYVAMARPARRAGGGRRAYLGSIPAFGVEVDGVLLDGVADGGPAQQAGLQAGDLIVQFGSMPVHNLEDLQAALEKHQPGQLVKVTVRRGTLRVTYPVKLRSRR